MRLLSTIGALATLAGLALPALAQDSVSRNSDAGNGFPGDALSPWSTGAGQKAYFVVDLADLRTASGAHFGIAPLLKSSKTSASRFTAVNGTSVLSQTVRTGSSFPNPLYNLWSVPGGGVNNTENNISLNTQLTPSGSPSVFGAGFLEFDEISVGSTLVFVNQVIGALVAFDPAQPDRLYVSRINAAVNSTLNQTDRSQLGVGGVDAHGNLYIRADSVGSTGAPAGLIQGDNYFRVRLADRSSFANLIDNNGASNASGTDWLLVRDPVTHAVPNGLAQDSAGRPVLIGADFLGNARYEASPGSLVNTTAHRPGTSDDRGGVTCSGSRVFPGSVGTGAMLTRSTGGNGRNDSLSVFGLGTNGQVLAARTLTIPPSIADACDAFVWPLAGGEFRHYDSQVTFRGGASPVAVTRDQAGRGIAAAVLYSGTSGSASNPTNAIVASRFDPANPQAAPQWTSVAWIDGATNTGKAIRGDYGADGAPGTNDAGEGDGVVDTTDAPIGRLAGMGETALGLDGPSLSAPAFDAAGNMFFLSSVGLRTRVGQQIVTQYDLALLRATYDPGSFCYTLDLVFRVGDTFHGRNSNTNYRIAALSVADLDSASSASLWPGNASQTPWNAIDNSSLDPGDPANLGGLVVSARIVYDADNDGQFLDPSLGGANAASPDEAYNAVLYIGNTTAPNVCIGDYNRSGGAPDDADIAAFFTDWNNGESRADVNGSGGTPDDADVAFFFVRWNAGC